MSEHLFRIALGFLGKTLIGGGIMSMINRVLLALGVVALDFAVFFLPLTAVFMAYILLYNPPWFREFLASLDAGQGKSSSE